MDMQVRLLLLTKVEGGFTLFRQASTEHVRLASLASHFPSLLLSAFQQPYVQVVSVHRKYSICIHMQREEIAHGMQMM